MSQRFSSLNALARNAMCWAGAASCLLAAPVLAQEPYFKGKSITIAVGSSAGGGYDTYARMISRHMGKHVEGAPTIIVSNMPGAGSNVAANYIYNVAKKDGTMIGALYASAPLEPLIGTAPVQHDPSKTQYLGSANNDVYVCIGRRDADVQNMQDLQQKEFIIGAQNSSTTSDFPLIMNAVLGAKFKLVLGYPGSREIGLAIEKKEVFGACGFAWPSISVTNPGWFSEGGIMQVMFQTHPAGHEELNKKGVPNAYSMTKTAEDKALLDLFFSQMVFGRPYVLPPETPAERVAVLRRAFLATLADPELLVEAKRANLEVNPVSGDDVQALIAKVYAAPPQTVARIKKALAPQP